MISQQYAHRERAVRRAVRSGRDCLLRRACIGGRVATRVAARRNVMRAVPKCLSLVALAAAVIVSVAPFGRAASVTTDDLLNAQTNAGEWLMYNRDYRAWRYSPLAQITPDNASQLRPVWAMSTGGQFGGLEATPLFHDGVLYFTADYARVFAVDARTGNILWHYEPTYGSGFDAMLCCGPVSRGVALKGDL